MSLFPAYALDLNNKRNEYEEATDGTESLALEAKLLASDNDEERESTLAGTVAASSHSLLDDLDYYIDRKLDVGNLRVSTLYYPGRPQYDSLPLWQALGAGGARAGRRAARARRYYRAPAAEPPLAAELAQRTAAFRDMLHAAPDDEALWLRFIDFQERSRDADAALAAAGEAAARRPASRALRDALHRARAAALPPPRRLQLLRAELAAAGPELRTELWLRALLCTGGADLLASAEAACAATRADPLAYPQILYVYGAHLRAAGLWERLVLLLELATGMNFPAAAAFPPPHDESLCAARERRLLEREDKLLHCGLPRHTRWVRLERARAAAHWRACPAADARADPQRAAQPADVAPLLQPAAARAAPALLAAALRLAKVPLLPAAQHALLALGAADARGDAAELDGGEALLALLRAARRLPPAHAARAPAPLAARLLHMFADPPHYFTDDDGYLSWVTALWDACCGWSDGAARVALLCWRLRWLHALQLLAAPGEARRLRGDARGALRRWAGAEPLPFAQWARLEHAAGDVPAARRALLHALRAARQDPLQRLYVARVAAELCDEACGAWATACAALGRDLPAAECLSAPPPAELLRAALQHCEARCLELEAQRAPAPGVLDALLPGAGEWAAARARLAPAARRAELERELCAAAPAATGYWEQAACALVAEAAREQRLVRCARNVAPLFPHNAFLALACSGAPLWAWDGGVAQQRRLAALQAPARSHRAALAHVLPALLRAAAAAWSAPAAARLAGVAARAARSPGAALLHAVRLEAEARAATPRPARALHAALDAHPHHKWLAVRGAELCGAQAAALADALLERELRAHALMEELTPPQDH